MTVETESIFKEVDQQMELAISYLNVEFQKIRTGKANPDILSGIMVDYYGSPTALSQVATVNTLDAKTLSIQPWEKNILDDIVKAISQSNLGLNPQDNGEMVLINIPILTEERRKDLCKQAKNEGENAKVSIRNSRKEANDNIKKLKATLSEDQIKDAEGNVQKITDDYIKKIDEMTESKSKDIMKV